MQMKRMLWLGGVAVVIAAGGAWIAAQVQEPLARAVQAGQRAPSDLPSYSQATGQPRDLDVPYVPTPQPVVDEMLKLAQVKKEDVVYDLGCGDGRIVVTAAKQFGARGIGVDIDPERIKDSKANAQKAGVTDRVKFVQSDLFKMDLKEATVVTLYLLPEINLKLRPKLFRELKPGTRIVSHDFDMNEWKPEKTVRVRADREHTLYFWTIPEKKDQPKFTDQEAT
jgi:SAM-dependent methyltransferase